MADLYLGRTVDPATGQVTEERATFDSNRLVTHAVGVGMTGSGKTGLCISLLEELVLNDVPLVIIDPKGDMANLALLFDEFKGEDFADWVDPGEAQRKGMSIPDYGEKMAGVWQKGLADWEQGPERLKELREKMALTIYTPGSDAGVAVDVLGAFAPPSDAVLNDPTARRELVTGTVSGLLGLVDVEADPVRDPEHVILSRIVDQAWSAGENLDVRMLIERLVDPPFERVGVFAVDEFYPPRNRRKLAMKLNGIVAAPAFEPWTRGVRLDVDRIADPVQDGDKKRVPVSLFYLTHLNDSERMFFASLLLEQIVAWSRAQSGTSSLRMLVYFDEVFGYLPPYPRNPPTKTPILTLMKQARAVGVGTALVTQNPVDLDYKALSNAGTWFIGRLQTQRDRERVLDGLLSAGGKVDRKDIDGMLDQLRSRVFLVHDVKADGPRLLHTRWAMSFLRGPMARREVERLMASGRLHKPETFAERAGEAPPSAPPNQAEQPGSKSEGVAPAASHRHSNSAPHVVSQAHTDRDSRSVRIVEHVVLVEKENEVPRDPRWSMPALPEGIPALFLRPEVALSARMGGVFAEHTQPARNDGRIRYTPALYAVAELRFDESRAGFDLRETQHRLFFPLTGDALPTNPLWPPLNERDTTANPPRDGWFDNLPTFLDESVEFETVRERIASELIERQSRGMWLNRKIGMYGKPMETRVSFMARCSARIERAIDDKTAGLRDDYAQRTRTLEAKIRGEYERLAALHAHADKLHHAAIAAAAANVMAPFSGQEMPDDVRQAWVAVKSQKSSVGGLNDQLLALEDDLKKDIARIRAAWEPLVGHIEEHAISLSREDITFPFFGVLWVPATKRPL